MLTPAQWEPFRFTLHCQNPLLVTTAALHTQYLYVVTCHVKSYRRPATIQASITSQIPLLSQLGLQKLGDVLAHLQYVGDALSLLQAASEAISQLCIFKNLKSCETAAPVGS